jgi:transcriptional regulator with XRE-family HTH domain
MNHMAEDPQVTPSQVRAARALLAWSQGDLAKAAGIATSTVADFERGQRTPQSNSSEAMRKAFEGAGIAFFQGGAITGPPRAGAPAGAAKAGSSAIRYVTATDLAQWSERRDAQGRLPELLTRLIRAAVGSSARLLFPSDESVQLAGWDGTCTVDSGTAQVPTGSSGWEIGTQAKGITAKANSDYDKRTAHPGEIEPKHSTYVFVTPRRWSKKKAWSRERKSEGVWADVRAYDADDLVHWIELYPAVGHWLATIMGKRPEGVRQLDEVWDEWSRSTKWPLTADVTLAGRDEETAQILKWLREAPRVIAVQGESTDEAIAFLNASIEELPLEYRLPYHSRCLVATTSNAARALGESLTPLIIALSDAEPGLAHSLAAKGHHVYVAYGSDIGAPDDLVRLRRPTREVVRSCLIQMKIDPALAEQFAQDSARSLAVLRRLMPVLPGRSPAWATSPPRGLLGALLTGAWEESNAADVAMVEKITGLEYAQLTADLAPLVKAPDSPIRKVGDTWKVTSPRDAWFLLAHHYTSIDLDRLTSAAREILAAPDPRFDLDEQERQFASIKRVAPPYSQHLRQGLIETLLLVSLFGHRIRSVHNAAAKAEDVVRRLLKNADGLRWWSLSHDFKLLAELAPEVFLEAVEDSLDAADTPVAVLFQEERGGFGGEYLSGLLWALELLAWDPRHLCQVSVLLARLDILDPGGRYQNRPKNSLLQIFMPWRPQTLATLDERLQVLDALRERTPDAAWRLLLGILPKSYGVSHQSPQPRWRELPSIQVEAVTHLLMARAARELASRLLSDVGTNATRWKSLLEVFQYFSPEHKKETVARLIKAAGQIDDDTQRSDLSTAVRRILYKHRRFAGADWALPASDLDELQRGYDALQPRDPLRRAAWLFQQYPDLEHPLAAERDEDRQVAQKLRLGVIENIYQDRGVEGLFALATLVKDPVYVGVATADLPADDTRDLAILSRGLNAASESEHEVARGLITALSRTRGEEWAHALLTRAKTESWEPDTVVRTLLALDAKPSIWQAASTFGAVVEDKYWKKASIYFMKDDANAVAFAIDRLIGARRAHEAVALAGHLVQDDLAASLRAKRPAIDRQGGGDEEVQRLPTALLIRVLQAAAAERWPDKADATMFQYYVTTILKALASARDVTQETMAQLEWTYLPLLEFSDRSPDTLFNALASSPGFFVEVLCSLYRPTKESGVDEPPQADTERATALAEQAFELLRTWNRVPGTQADGSLDAASLEAWVREARTLCARTGRAEVGDQHIGQILALSPVDPSGMWPSVAIRDVIESTRSRELENGIAIGVVNGRGVTTRGVTEGGVKERSLAAAYRGWARTAATKWHRTAAVLERIARDLEGQGDWHDEGAERIQW